MDLFGRFAAAVICLHLGACRLTAADALQEPNLVVTALHPSNGAKEICPDTPLRITFASLPLVGAGKVQLFDAATDTVVETIEVSTRLRTKSIGSIPNFNYYPVLITGNEVALYLPDNSLGYAKTYYVKVDVGALKNRDDHPFTGLSEAKSWHFSTKAALAQSAIDAEAPLLPFMWIA